MQLLVAWIVAFIVAAAPPTRPQFIPEAKETQEETLARYESTAHDIIDVVYDTDDPAGKPLFRGDYGRGRTVATVLSIMLHESGYRKDVDFGLGKLSRGDSGQSWCNMQIRIGDGKTVPWNKTHGRFAYADEIRRWKAAESPALKDGIHTAPLFDDVIEDGWTGPELVQDRKKCITAGLRIIRASFGACQKLPMLDWLRVYASGSCDGGADASHNRMGTAIRWYSKHPAPMKDEDVVALLHPTDEEGEDFGGLPLPTTDTARLLPVRGIVWLN